MLESTGSVGGRSMRDARQTTAPLRYCPFFGKLHARTGCPQEFVPMLEERT